MALNKLTAADVKNAKPGLLGDGGGLFLQVKGGKSWTFKFIKPGARTTRQMGLGSLEKVGLARARELAAECRAKVAAGIDPIDERDGVKAAEVAATAAVMTFRSAATRYIAAHEAGWRNEKHGKQWTATLATYAYPHIGDLPVAEVDAAAVLKVLTPLWAESKVETGTRLRGRIAAILDYAAVHGWRPRGFNPATWKGNLSHTLAARSKVKPVQHHPALPWKEAPAFLTGLATKGGQGAPALTFAILTAARSGEVRGALWREIDMHGALWTIPASRMKAGREQRVPLSEAALAVLREAAKLVKGRPDPDALVFPGMVRGRPLSDMTLTAVLRRMGRDDLTAHGFRSTFRDWCAETGQPADIAEAALAHVVGDKTVAAYARGDLLERRRALMAAWADFCTSAQPPAGNEAVAA